MAAKESAASGGIGLGGCIFIVFLTLKLCGKIDWSWWWVTSPLWIPLAVFLSILAAIFGVVGLMMLFALCVTFFASRN